MIVVETDPPEDAIDALAADVWRIRYAVLTVLDGEPPSHILTAMADVVATLLHHYLPHDPGAIDLFYEQVSEHLRNFE